MSDDRADLRRRLRAVRRSIDDDRRRTADEAVAGRIATLLPRPHRAGWCTGAVVAGYVATDGELDPAPSLRVLEDAGAATALPRIDGDVMTFHTESVGRLIDGPVGLRQPAADAPEVEPRALVLVLCPLVGFDEARNRLGRGRAYYDRAFAFLLDAPHRPCRPVLVGLAHDEQQIDHLVPRAHDVALDLVITPTRIVGDVEVTIAALG